MMSSLQGFGLAAALLAASGGVAFASWSYISARRQRRAAAPDVAPVQEKGPRVTNGDSGEDPVPDIAPVEQLGHRAEHLGSCIPVLDEDPAPDIAPVEQLGHRAEHLASCIPVLDEDPAPDIAPVEQLGHRAEHLGSCIPVLDEDPAPDIAPVEQLGQRAEHLASCIPVLDEDPAPDIAPVEQLGQRAEHLASCIPVLDEDPAPDIAPVEQLGHRAEHLGSCIPVLDEDSGEDPVPDIAPVEQQGHRAEHLASCIPVLDEDPAPDIAPVEQLGHRAEHLGSCIPVLDEDPAPDIAPVEQQQGDKEELGPTPALDGEEGAAAHPDITPVKEDHTSKGELSSTPVLDTTAAPGTTHLYGNDMRTNQDFSPVQMEVKTTGPTPLLHKENKREASDRTPVESPVEKEIIVNKLSTEMQPKGKTSQVLVLGLDGSGKTSVLNSIAANRGKLITTPTEGVNAMCLNNGNSKMEFLEIGGSEQLRPYWKMYLSRAFAVIFVVDSADHSRLPLAKRHLHQLIQQDSVLPLMVLANKQDLQNAYHIPEIHDALALSEICEDRKLFLIGTHVTKDSPEISSGIQDAKEFLAQLLSETTSIIT